MADLEPLAAWPALAGLPPRLPGEIRCERGVLAKEPGGDGDFRWIAASPGFSGPTSDLAQTLWLGSEDVLRPTLLWRGDAGGHRAVGCYRGRSPDSQGRHYLEKQVLEWGRPAELPAALGALVLLPAAAALDDSVWQRRERFRLAERLFVPLGPGDLASLPLDPAGLQATVRAGTSELRRRFRPVDLGDLYARLLAGFRGVFPPQAMDPPPLGPAALAALLLPLPRETADRIDLVAWLPSSYAESDRLAQHWDLILGHDLTVQPRPPRDSEPGAEHRERGLAMAEAVLAEDPRALIAGPTRARPRAGPAGDTEPARLMLWGPSGSGKTVFLAQLYWQLSGAQGGDWDIYPGESGLDFFQSMRDIVYSRNAFPPPTTPGEVRSIVCHLRHRRTGERVTLALEDRAGADYEGLHDEVMERLQEADGIVLLIDPYRRGDKVFGEIANTFDRLSLACGRIAEKDERPLALCVTKADALIETPEDYRLALTEPDAFARRHVDRRLLAYLESRFARYRLFPSSAAGVRMQHGAIEPVVFYDETLRARIHSGEPLNLLAPVDWLIAQVWP